MDLTYDAVSNSGERILAGDPTNLVEVHEQRYQFALDYVYPDFRVLDCACGSGYGSKMLSTRARQVMGMDISPVAIEYAQKKQGADNLKFKTGSALDLPIAENLTDVYVSFETIEHVDDPLRLVEEAYRVLKPGGVFLVSTPNRVWSGLASGEKPKNPFHLVEWSLLEFDALLRHRFKRIEHFGQRIRSANKFHPQYVRSKLRRAFGSLDILPLSTGPKQLNSHQSPDHWQPENFLAVCRK